MCPGSFPMGNRVRPASADGESQLWCIHCSRSVLSGVGHLHIYSTVYLCFLRKQGRFCLYSLVGCEPISERVSVVSPSRSFEMSSFGILMRESFGGNTRRSSSLSKLEKSMYFTRRRCDQTLGSVTTSSELPNGKVQGGDGQ